MARLAAFPKAWLDPLCLDGSMKLEEWIDLSLGFDIDGLEFYAGFLDLRDEGRIEHYRRRVADQGRSIPMLCCSPDFTHPDPDFRRAQVAKQKGWIELTARLGGQYCRVLSGQRRPGLTLEEGIRYAAEGIASCRDHALRHGVTLILENHYKDGYWDYPEFAQRSEVFLALLEAVPRGPGFGVNFDPSNCLLCGEDPIALLEAVKDRVVTMHASDRFFAGGTLEDLRRQDQDPAAGYATILRHGVIGQGMNDYDRIFQILQEVGFAGWISIEDGTDLRTSFEDVRQSARFLREKMLQYNLHAP